MRSSPATRRIGASDFLVTATPGAGKTTFALTLAVRLLNRRVVDRIVVVAPTDHLRTQWAEAADRLGVVLDPNLPNSVGPVREGAAGYVTTYAQVAGKPRLHAGRATARRTLVILDEVHHAGDGLSWGEAVFEAFERAARRLCLTGTPFRTRADERIPFVRYTDDGEGNLASTADYTYGYREALRDGVVRPVVFAAYTGTSRWRNSAGEVVAASLTEAGTRSTEAAAWKTALDARGQWVPHVLAAMDERITQLRANGIPDAAGLVLASDQDDARAYAKIVERVTGEAPEVILSDDPKASAKIADFTVGTKRMAVCVRMVSEGVDVPRAACLAWMTSYRTPLFFAQAVGRVVRARARHESATVFLPAVRPLLALAAELESDRNHVLPPPKPSSEELDPLPPPERDEAEVGQWEALDADAEFAHVLHGGRAVLADASHAEPVGPLSDDQEDLLGLPGLLTPEQTAALLARQDSDLRKRISSVRRATARPQDAEPRRQRVLARRRRPPPRGQPAGRAGGGAPADAARRDPREAAGRGARAAVRVGVGGVARRAARPPHGDALAVPPGRRRGVDWDALAEVSLPDLESASPDELDAGGRHDGLAFADLAELPADEAVFLDCRFSGGDVGSGRMRRTRLNTCVLEDLRFSELDASGSTWSEVVLRNCRVGALVAADAGLSDLTVDGGRLDYVNLRMAKLARVQFLSCTIGELDLGAAELRDVRFVDCELATLVVRGARLSEVDLRGARLGGVEGIGELGGAVISPAQLVQLAPALAAHLGIRVADG